MNGPQAEQAAAESTSGKRSRRWTQVMLAVAGAVVLVCCGVPTVWVIGPLIAGTLHADHGEPSPEAALLAFVFTFDDGPNATGVERLIVPEQRAAIVKQRRAYLAQMAADTKKTGWSATFEIGSEMSGNRVETHGDRATVVDSYHVRWTPPADAAGRTAGGSPVLWYDGSSRQWRAEAHRDSTGWRLWSVAMPPWCGPNGYSRCSSSPARSPSPSPSPSPDDPLGGVRSMLPCGPADPLRQYHDCPSLSPS